MKKIFVLIVMAMIMMSCQKEAPEYSTDQGNTIKADPIATMTLTRVNASPTRTMGAIQVTGVSGFAAWVYELPKVNTVWNQFKPNVCVPVGTYEYVKVANGFEVTVPDVGVILYQPGETFLYIIPRGGVVYEAKLLVGGVVVNYPNAVEAMQMLLDRIPDTGFIKIK